MDKIKETVLREFGSVGEINEFFVGDENIIIISMQYCEFKRSHLVYYTYK